MNWAACFALLGLAACGGAMEPARAEYGASPDMASSAPAASPTRGAMTESESMDDSPAREESLELAARADSEGSKLAQAPSGGAAPAPPPPPAPSPQGAGNASTSPGPSEVAAVRGPMLIYTAELTMAVFEVGAALTQIEELSREVGGFLARRDDMSITIRVPVAVFDRTLKRIEKSGDMLHRNVTAQDVTEEFRDLEVRLRNARAVRDRLEQLLAKAVKVEESVTVERELERVTGELERLAGKIKFLKDRAAFSTITVSFQPKRQETLSQSPFHLPVPWVYQLGLSRLLSL